MLAGSVKRVVTDLRGLPRQFWVLAAGILVFLIGVEMTYPFETLYLNQELGVSMTTLGVILGVTLLATLPLQVAGGAVCDKVGRRPVLIVAILASMTLYIGLGLTRDLAVIVALIAFEAAFGWAQFITASNAMIADVTTLEQRTEAFSVSRVALNAGISIGPFIALSLLGRGPLVPAQLLRARASSAPASCSSCSRACGRPGPRPPGRCPSRPPSAATAPSCATGSMLAFCLIALLPLYAFGQIWATMPVMLADLHGVTAQRWSVAMVVYGVSMVVLQYPVIRVLSPQRPHGCCCRCRASPWAPGSGVAAFVPWPATLACIVSIALGLVLLLPIAAAVVSGSRRWSCAAATWASGRSCTWAATRSGRCSGGWALDALGGRAAFAVVTAACLVGAALFPLLRRGVRARIDEAERLEAAEALGAQLTGERPEQAV